MYRQKGESLNFWANFWNFKMLQTYKIVYMFSFLGFTSGLSLSILHQDTAIFKETKQVN